MASTQPHPESFAFPSQRMTRRQALKAAGCGFGYLALAGERIGSVGAVAWEVVEWKAALPVAAASLLTARIGTRLSEKFGGEAYRRAFAGLLAIMAVRMLMLAR